MSAPSPWLVIEALFLFAPLVLVPLALTLVEPAGAPRGVRGLVHAGGGGVLLSFVARRGSIVAAAGALSWLGVTMWLALWGAARLRSGRSADRVATSAALLTLPVGGAWLLASRLGLEPMGFAEPIVLLTAVHFHYAGFLSLVWAGSAARHLPADATRATAVAGVALGTPLLAAGIALAPALALGGAVVLAASLGGLAVRVLREVCPGLERGAFLLRLSAVSVLVTLALAVLYAAGPVARPVVSLALMARVHGTLNALGFGLCGLLGWRRVTFGGGSGRSR